MKTIKFLSIIVIMAITACGCSKEEPTYSMGSDLIGYMTCNLDDWNKVNDKMTPLEMEEEGIYEVVLYYNNIGSFMTRMEVEEWMREYERMHNILINDLEKKYNNDPTLNLKFSLWFHSTYWPILYIDAEPVYYDHSTGHYDYNF